MVYAKRPFAGPEAVLAYLARYTHRVAISSSRLVSLDTRGVTFRWKDYRADGEARRKLMTLSAEEFIRSFLIHVLPGRFHRIRHCGLLANTVRAANLAKLRALLPPPEPPPAVQVDAETEVAAPPRACPCCGGRMLLIENLRARRGAPERTDQAGNPDRHLVTAMLRAPSLNTVLQRRPPRPKATPCAQAGLRDNARVPTAPSARPHTHRPPPAASAQGRRPHLIAGRTDALGQPAALKPQ